MGYVFVYDEKKRVPISKRLSGEYIGQNGEVVTVAGHEKCQWQDHQESHVVCKTCSGMVVYQSGKGKISDCCARNGLRFLNSLSEKTLKPRYRLIRTD